jgi:hypothetical protein
VLGTVDVPGLPLVVLADVEEVIRGLLLAYVFGTHPFIVRARRPR